MARAPEMQRGGPPWRTGPDLGSGPAAGLHVRAWRRLDSGKRHATKAAATGVGGPGVLQKLGRVLKEKAVGDLGRIFTGATKTREKLGVLDELFAYWTLEESEQTLEGLEEILIVCPSLAMADFGPKTALKVVDDIRTEIRAGRLKSSSHVKAALKRSIIDIFKRARGSSALALGSVKPMVILVVGVNGGGKTTTIGKLAYQLTQEGGKVLLAAGDTFRAAAAEQLAGWADRAGAGLAAPSTSKQRPDALMYSAVDRAEREGMDVVICDTSGRLHTNVNLMDELAKCKRSISKRLPSAPHEVLLVLDGTTGLNMLPQAREFHDTVGLTGLVLTKLDGTARGGAVVAVADELRVPVKFLGVGEAVADLQPFDATAFVDALLPDT